MVAICTLISERAPLASNWICYHIALGATTIFVYSDDPSRTRAGLRDLSPIAAAVDVLPAAQGASPLDALDDCIARAAARSRWLALIGPNDYLNPLVAPTLAGAIEREPQPEPRIPLTVLPFALTPETAAPGTAPFERSFALAAPRTPDDGLEPLLVRPSTSGSIPGPSPTLSKGALEIAMVVNRYADEPMSGSNGYDTRISRHFARFRAVTHLVPTRTASGSGAS